VQAHAEREHITIFTSLRIPFKEGKQKAQQTPNAITVTFEKVFVDWSV
jgi:hypothetical protein